MSIAPPSLLPGLKDRHGITTPWMWALLALAALPLACVALRILALASPMPSGPIAIGDWLNQHLQLLWVAAEDRDTALMILLLPLAAVLTALTRLTLGLRVLGFRAILIAIAFQEIGLLASLILLVVVAASVVVVRPLMRRSRMPLYARVSTILCIVALILTASLLGGAWVESGTLWSMAFFPVVILAMLAESVAATVARDNLKQAFWRLAITVALAGLIAGLSQLTVVRELALAAPELILTQLVAIVWISEFLDLRLFEERMREGSDASARPPVIVVRSRFGEMPLRPYGQGVPQRYRRASLQGFVDGLRGSGYPVEVVESDAALPARLRSSARAGQPPIVINLSAGSQGRGRRSWTASCCETLGIPYTGPTPEAPALRDDRWTHLALLEAAGLTVPERLTLSTAREQLAQKTSEVVIRPRHEADRKGLRVSSVRTFERQIVRLKERYGEVLIEGAPRGRSLSAVVFGTAISGHWDPVILEKKGSVWRGAQDIDDVDRNALQHAAKRAYDALGCRHIARIDLEICCSGLLVRHVDALELPTRRGAVMAAAETIGIDLQGLGYALVKAACRDAGLDATSAHTDASSNIAPTKDHQSAPRRTSAQGDPPCATSA